jgi:biotin carboxylase
VKGDEKRILLLSATTGYQLRAFGEAADRLGYELAFATDRCHRLDDPWQDRAIAVRFHDIPASLQAIEQTAGQNPFDGILVVGDRPVRLAAAAASALGLPGNPPHAAAASGDKRETRVRFASAGMPVPWFRTIDLTTAAPERELACAIESDDVRWPCVLKPLGLSGSRGVIRADTPSEAPAALTRIRALLARPDVRALRSSGDDAVLVEGYIEGREYALEGVLTSGTLRSLAILAKPDPLEGPYFEETIFLVPPGLGPREEQAAVVAVQHACSALGLQHGPIHAEFRMGDQGIFVLEIAARPIGGLCSRVLRFGERRVSLEEVLLRHAAGEQPEGLTREALAAGVMMIPIPARGILKRVDGLADARAVPYVEAIHVTAKPDQLLEPLPEAGSYLGFIFARADSPGEVDTALREAHGRLRFAIQHPIPVARST